MKKQFMMASILSFCMGIAQAQQPAPMQGGGQDPNAARSSGAQTSGGMQNRGTGAAAAGATGTVDQAAAPQSFKGCLTQSSGNWTLAADNGQTLRISGTEDQLSSYNNQQVNIQGTEATDGTVKVASIDKVSDSCNATGQAATSTEQPSTTSSMGSQPPSGTGSASTGAMSSQSTTTSQSNSAGSEQTSNTASAAPGQSATGAQGAAGATAANPTTTTPPVTEQTPANTVGGNTSDQGAAQKPPTSTTGQSATAGSEQNVPHISDMDNTQAAGKRLPQTASPLPLLGLIGLGSLVTGLVARRRK